jgi:hypothetical protein
MHTTHDIFDRWALDVPATEELEWRAKLFKSCSDLVTEVKNKELLIPEGFFDSTN